MSRRLYLPLFGALLALALWWFWPTADRPPALTTPEASHQGTDSPVSKTIRTPTVPDDESSPVFQEPLQPAAPARGDPAPPTAPPCEPKARVICHEGDVYWLDTCGDRTLKRDCGDRLCHRGACPRPPKAERCTRDDGVLGRCDGGVAVSCHGGRRHRVDCTEFGEACLTDGDVGARCGPPPDPACPPGPICKGDRLTVCVDGTLQSVDCNAMDAACEEGPGGARCVRDERMPAPPEEDDECGPCGCAEESPAAGVAQELTEAEADEAVDIVAFIAADDRGGSSYSTADIALEVDRINGFFGDQARVNTGLRFELADVVRISRPAWQRPDRAQLNEMTTAPQIHPVRERFYIPLVFTDVVMTGRTPKLGTSTLPNGTCGGARQLASRHVPVGVILLSKARHDTTGAHEIGHFLGLCHTHGQAYTQVTERRSWATEEGTETVECEECLTSGDGVCDTPPDPGRESCTYDALMCQPRCGGAGDPDVNNLMSYYHQCRDRFTDEQAALMKKTLELRRTWHKCLTPGGCPCDPREPTCPGDMSCRPVGSQAQSWECGLDGATAVETRCAEHAECGPGAICVDVHTGGSRCRIVCDPSKPGGCRCLPLPAQVVGVCE